jgi:cyclohexanecarboxylate-CoA ligase
MTVRRPDVAGRAAHERAAGTWLGRFIDEYVASAARMFPGRVAVVDDQRTLTYREANLEVNAIARGLIERGVGSGDVVSWQLPNWHEAFLLHHAVLRIGAVSNPIVPIYRAHEVDYILREARSTVMVVPETFRGFEHRAMVAELSPGLPDLRHVITVRPGRANGDAFADLLVRGATLDPMVRSADDPAVLMFTSGTTARPKGVLHTHNTLDYENRSMIDVFGLTGDAVVFMPSPVSHVTGMLYGLQLPPMLAAPTILQPVWQADEALELLAKHRCTFTVAATPFLHGIVHHPRRTEFDLSELQTFACGGADVPSGLVRRARQELGCWVTRIYGSTEFPTLSTTGPTEPEIKAETTDGRAIGAARYRIVDEAGTEVGAGSIGELQVQGPESLAGYLRPEDGVGVMTDDGWFLTGDLASADLDGYVTIRGRKKDIVLRGGENLSVSEIEDLLFEHPDIAEVAIVAMPDPVMVERACAYVVPVDGARPTLADLAAFLDTRQVAKQKYPERLELVAELPKTQSGKVQKYVLRNIIQAKLNEELAEQSPR